MDFLEGKSVENLIDDKGSLGTLEAAEIVLGVSSGLTYLEEHSLLHRDIKPSNIVISNNIPKLIDFGVVKMTNRDYSLTTQDIVIGTPDYIAPELLCGKKVDIRSDIYSLGASFYHMITGTPPFTGGSITEILQKRLVRSPNPKKLKPNLHKDVAMIIQKMMHRSLA